MTFVQKEKHYYLFIFTEFTSFYLPCKFFLILLIIDNIQILYRCYKVYIMIATQCTMFVQHCLSARDKKRVYFLFGDVDMSKRDNSSQS